MNIFMKFVLVAVLGMALPAWAGSGSKMLLVYEVIGLPPSYTTSFNAYVASPQYSSQAVPANNNLPGLTYALANNQVSGAAGVTQIPLVPDAPTPNQQALLQVANQSVQQALPWLTGQMAAYLQRHGLAQGMFTYEQAVMVQNNQQPMYLYWQVMVDASGRSRFGDVQLIPGQPKTLYGEYTPLAVANGLPASFAYPGAGTMQWEEIQPPTIVPGQAAAAVITPLTAMQGIALGGVFDTPQPVNTPVDPQWGAECLISHAAWTAANATVADPPCPVVPINGYTDFASLLNAQGANFGVLDYVETLRPVYNQVQQNGQTVNQAQVSVDVTSRTMQNGGYTNCSYSSDYPYVGAAYSGYSIINGGGGACSSYEDETVSATNPSICGGEASGYIAGYVPQAVAGYICSDTNGNPVVFNALFVDPNPQDYTAWQNWLTCQYLYTGCTAPTASFSATFGAPYLPRTPYSPGAADQSASGPSPWLWYQQNGGVVSDGVDGNGNPIYYPTNGLTTPYVVQRTITPGPYGTFYPGNINIYPLGGNSGPTYTNAGSIGYQLNSTVDRYLVMADGSYTFLGTFPNPSALQANAQPYTYTVTLTGSPTPAGLANIIIDPWGSGQTYDYTQDPLHHLPASDYNVSAVQ